MKFGKKKVLELIEVMDKHQLSELSIRNWFTSVEIKRGHSPSRQATAAADGERRTAWTGLPAAQTDPPAAALLTPVPENSNEPASENYFQVQAPLVGTFYRASAPDAEPFVEIGDSVKAGDVLCVIEAMKNMNEIQTDIDGIIREICIENGALVEFGKLLFKIEEIAGDS
ncbi:MAG: acetyl-CoA carboxylase biotin carboxyl carrier protein [Candidatus Aminicenantes bacterium]|nr:acetyl-CoA carboxylase biotin carboxyl carrier protein [Candidatus Aminicenantes bacterium]